MDIKRILGNNVKIHRKRLGFTQEQLAERLDISANHLAKLETGVNFASPELIASIADTLTVPPHYLFYTDDYKNDIYHEKIKRILLDEMEVAARRIREI